MIMPSAADVSSCSDVSDSLSDDTTASSPVSSTTGSGVSAILGGKPLAHAHAQQRCDDICRDYLRNVCRRGPRCKYRHPTSDEAKVRLQGSKVLGQMSEFTFCHDFQNSGCRRPNCKFMHCTREEEDYYKQTGQLPVRLQQAAALGIGQLGVLPKTLPILRGEVPICKDYLKGECKRAGRCKFRHLTLGQYDLEVKRSDQPLIANTAPVITQVTAPQQAVVLAAAENVGPPTGPPPMAAQPPPQTINTPAAVMAASSFTAHALAAETHAARMTNNYEVAAKRRRLEIVQAPPAAYANSFAAQGFQAALPMANNLSNLSNLNTLNNLSNLLPTVSLADYGCTENDVLKRKIDELKKQVTTLIATNDVLLEQNARFRHTPMNKLCNVTMPNAPPIVSVSQVVTPTITPAPAVARQPHPSPIMTPIATPQQIAQVAASQQISQGMSMLYEHCTKTAELITLNQPSVNQLLSQSQLAAPPPTVNALPPVTHNPALAPLPTPRTSISNQAVTMAPVTMATSVMVPVSLLDTSLAPPPICSVSGMSGGLGAMQVAASMAHDLHQRQQQQQQQQRGIMAVAQTSLPPAALSALSAQTQAASMAATAGTQALAALNPAAAAAAGPLPQPQPQPQLGGAVHNSAPLVSYPVISHTVAPHNPRTMAHLPSPLTVGVLQQSA